MFAEFAAMYGKRKMRRYEAYCSTCKHTFVLKTNHKLLGLILTLEYWKFDLDIHKVDCLNRQTIELRGGYYEKKA